jgi:hypothetical protein
VARPSVRVLGHSFDGAPELLQKPVGRRHSATTELSALPRGPPGPNRSRAPSSFARSQLARGPRRLPPCNPGDAGRDPSRCRRRQWLRRAAAC